VSQPQQAVGAPGEDRHAIDAREESAQVIARRLFRVRRRVRDDR